MNDECEWTRILKLEARKGDVEREVRWLREAGHDFPASLMLDLHTALERVTYAAWWLSVWNDKESISDDERQWRRKALDACRNAMPYLTDRGP